MIELPWPNSALAGHNKGHWAIKAKVVATHRAWAFHATRAAKVPAVPDAGDIAIRFRFVPPHNRGDRTNYPILLKPYIDGIAEALGINDRRFLPSYDYAAPEKPGRVEVFVGEMAEDAAPPSRACQSLTLHDTGIAGVSPQEGEAA